MLEIIRKTKLYVHQQILYVFHHKTHLDGKPPRPARNNVRMILFCRRRCVWQHTHMASAFYLHALYLALARAGSLPMCRFLSSQRCIRLFCVERALSPICAHAALRNNHRKIGRWKKAQAHICLMSTRQQYLLFCVAQALSRKMHVSHICVKLKRLAK